MAHTCPVCGGNCHCHGDVDDCVLDGTEEDVNCTHYLVCDMDEQDVIDDALNEAEAEKQMIDEAAGQSDGRDEGFDGSAEERTPSLDTQRRDALRGDA